MTQEHSIVIGGTRGLGRVVVQRLNHQGHCVSVIARNLPTNISNTVDDTSYFHADLLDQATFLQVLSDIVKEKGALNHLIFIQRHRGKGEYWHDELEVTLNATRKAIEHLSDKFKSHSNTSIIMVSSVAGLFANDTQPLCYSIGKAGLNHMVKYYASALGQYGIRVNGVSPIGFIKEESKEYYLNSNNSLNALYQAIVPLKRMCTADDVANSICFLCSRGASFISGQNIVLDGGLSVQSHETLAFKLNNG